MFLLIGKKINSTKIPKSWLFCS